MEVPSPVTKRRSLYRPLSSSAAQPRDTSEPNVGGAISTDSGDRGSWAGSGSGEAGATVETATDASPDATKLPPFCSGCSTAEARREGAIIGESSPKGLSGGPPLPPKG